MGDKDHQGQGRRDAEGERGAHFLTGIRPSWFTCSFSFVYLGKQVQGSEIRTGQLNPRCSPEEPQAHAFRRKVFREAF